MKMCMVSLILSLFAMRLEVSAQELNLVRNESAVVQTIAARLLKDIYKHAGMTVNITPLPGARTTAVVLAGERDGEIARLDLHHVLVASRKDLATKISAAITALKGSGELARLTKRYESEAVNYSGNRL